MGKDPHLSSLLANVVRVSDKQRTSVPPWDLALVLTRLTEALFEPIHKAEIKFTTLKTVFLVALASGKCHSEIHAMGKEILHTEDWGSVSIVLDPQFVAKTQLNNRGSAMLNVVTMKAFTKLLPSDMQEDRSLCPVMVLRYYHRQTHDIRKDQRKLFISFKTGCTQEIHMNAISLWLKESILMAYGEDGKASGVKGHQVRSLAASWALLANASIEDIMSACS